MPPIYSHSRSHHDSLYEARITYGQSRTLGAFLAAFGGKSLVRTEYMKHDPDSASIWAKDQWRLFRTVPGEEPHAGYIASMAA